MEELELNDTGSGSNMTAPDTPLLTMSRLSRLVCGRNISGNPFSSGGPANRFVIRMVISSYHLLFRFDNLRDQIKEKDDFQYNYDNTTSEVCVADDLLIELIILMTLTINIIQECNALIESMERSAGIRFLWSNIKPFIRGKILYTPDNPTTR